MRLAPAEMLSRSRRVLLLSMIYDKPVSLLVYSTSSKIAPHWIRASCTSDKFGLGIF